MELTTEILENLKENLVLALLDFEHIGFKYRVDIYNALYKDESVKGFKMYKDIICVGISFQSKESFNRKPALRNLAVESFGNTLLESIDKFNILSEYKFDNFKNDIFPFLEVASKPSSDYIKKKIIKNEGLSHIRYARGGNIHIIVKLSTFIDDKYYFLYEKKYNGLSISASRLPEFIFNDNDKSISFESR